MHELGTAYGREKAQQYDEQSRFDKGNRELHRHWLVDAIAYLKPAPRSFVDLGCGTGYFAEAIFETFPGIRGTLVDGSVQMLELARQRLHGKAAHASFECGMLESLDWKALGAPEVVFSSLTVHFLDDAGKWQLFRDIHAALPEGGIFILFDQFDPKEERWSLLLEHLACKDLKRRVEHEMQLDFELDELKIERLVQKARQLKIEDQEKDAPLDEHVAQLKAAGFGSVCPLFQETRFFGLLTIK